MKLVISERIIELECNIIKIKIRDQFKGRIWDEVWDEVWFRVNRQVVAQVVNQVKYENR